MLGALEGDQRRAHLAGQIDACRYGVAGSWVVETTTTLPGPGELAGCGVDVGGTGHIAHTSRGANPVKSPYAMNGATCRICRSASAHTAGSVGYGESTQRIAANASCRFW